MSLEPTAGQWLEGAMRLWPVWIAVAILVAVRRWWKGLRDASE